MLATTRLVLAADWAAAGTITVAYPAGVEGGHLSPADHKITVLNGAQLLQGRDFALTTVNKASAVLTLAAGIATIPAGSTLFVEYQIRGPRTFVDPTVINGANRVSQRHPIEVNFGSPSAAAVAAVAAIQLLGAAGNMVLNGSLVANGVAVFDVPRNVTLTVATTNQSALTFTVTGFDEYNQPIIENITGPNNNTVSGVKAFKRITRIAVSGAIATNGVSVGTGTALGFPVFLANVVHVLYDTQDEAVVTDGTYVAGVLTKPTATTGDVRGTYVPNAAPDGTRRYTVVMLADDPAYLGSPQFAG